MNEFDVPSTLHGQVRLVAVNQICVIHEAMNGYKKAKGSVKACFKNVKYRGLKAYILVYEGSSAV